MTLELKKCFRFLFAGKFEEKVREELYLYESHILGQALATKFALQHHII